MIAPQSHPLPQAQLRPFQQALMRLEMLASMGGPDRRRAGFTALEMIIVVGVMILLASLALPSFIRAQRNAVLTQAEAAIRDISEMSHGMALRTTTDRDGHRFGVGLVPQTNGATEVRVLWAVPTDPDPTAKIYQSVGYQSEVQTIKRLIPASVAVYVGNTELPQVGQAQSKVVGSNLHWFFENSTGMTIAYPDGQTIRATQVGVLPPRLTTMTTSGSLPNYYAVVAQAPGIILEPHSTAPGAAGVPGFSLRLRGDPMGRALSIYATGQFHGVPYVR